MIKTRSLFILAGIILLVIFLKIFWFTNSPENKLAHPIPHPTATGTQKKLKEAKKNQSGRPQILPQFSKKYSFHSINQQIQKGKNQLALCYLKNKDFNQIQVKMTLHWKGTGEFEGVELFPDPGESVKDCIHSWVKTLHVQPHSGHQPFSYEVLLLPGTL